MTPTEVLSELDSTELDLATSNLRNKELEDAIIDFLIQNAGGNSYKIGGKIAILKKLVEPPKE